MAIDKRINYKVQGKIKNYLGNQKTVKAPLHWQSAPNHPTTELAYITKKEKDLLIPGLFLGPNQPGLTF